MTFLPKTISLVKAPPVKCQGIKTKLVNFIGENIVWQGNGRWIEPFLGSGVVAFNIAPQRALLTDANKHILGIYQDIQAGRLNEEIAKEFLRETGAILKERGEEYYYEMRERFNQNGGSLNFLFLNRACFNGVVRFNSKGGFNVPFGHKPNRFRQQYVTKICNQIKWLRRTMEDKGWTIAVRDWRNTLAQAQPEDFVYLDPPYIGRHTDYFNSWSEQDAEDLARLARALPCGFALSMWKENKYRTNTHLADHWQNLTERTFDHFYHIGATESLRNKMIESLIIKPGYAAEIRTSGKGRKTKKQQAKDQLAFALE
jgi:DNA adenine methylase